MSADCMGDINGCFGLKQPVAVRALVTATDTVCSI